MTVREVLKDVEYIENHPCLANDSIKTSFKNGTLSFVLPTKRNFLIMTYAVFHVSVINIVYIWGGVYKSLNFFSGFMGAITIIIVYSFIHMMTVKKTIIVNSKEIHFYLEFLGLTFLKRIKQENVERVFIPKGSAYLSLRIKSSQGDILIDRCIRSKEVVTYLKIMIEKALWPDKKHKFDFNITGRRDHRKAKLDAGKASGKLSSSTT